MSRRARTVEKNYRQRPHDARVDVATPPVASEVPGPAGARPTAAQVRAVTFGALALLIGVLNRRLDLIALWRDRTGREGRHTHSARAEIPPGCDLTNDDPGRDKKDRG